MEGTYYETLTLVTHEALDYDADLCEFPDYVTANKLPLDLTTPPVRPQR